MSIKNIDILCVNESRLKINQNLPAILGYDIFRRDIRANTSDRGIAIIVKSTFKIKEITIINNNERGENIEHLTISVRNNFNKSFIVACVYRHPKYTSTILNNDYEFFDEFLTLCCQTGKSFYVLGDCNFRDNKSVGPLNKILNKLSLTQIIDEPARGDNILDLIITNDLPSIISKLVYNPHLSDHSYIECVVKYNANKPIKKHIEFRNYNNINKSAVINDINEIKINQEDSVDNATDKIVDGVKRVFNKYAPIRKVSFFQHTNKKFVSLQTKSLMRDRDKLYKSMRLDPTLEGCDLLKVYNKSVKMQIMSDTKNEFNKKVEELHMWGALKKLYPMVQPAKDINMDADDINKFFAAISTRDPLAAVPPLPSKPALPWDNKGLTFGFNVITVDIVGKAWKSTKNRGSTTYDNLGICNNMFNICMGSFMFQSVIAKLLN